MYFIEVLNFKKFKIVRSTIDHYPTIAYLTCFARTMYSGRRDNCGGTTDDRCETYGCCPWWNLLCSYWIQLSSKKFTANSTMHRNSMKHTTTGKDNHRTLILHTICSKTVSKRDEKLKNCKLYRVLQLE